MLIKFHYRVLPKKREEKKAYLPENGYERYFFAIYNAQLKRDDGKIMSFNPDDLSFKEWMENVIR